MCWIVAGIESKFMSTWPDITSITACPLPLYGTCTSSIPAIDRKSSAAMCCRLPAPDDAYVIAFGWILP